MQYLFEILCYFFLACHSFIGVGRRHETSVRDKELDDSQHSKHHELHVCMGSLAHEVP